MSDRRETLRGETLREKPADGVAASGLPNNRTAPTPAAPPAPDELTIAGRTFRSRLLLRTRGGPPPPPLAGPSPPRRRPAGAGMVVDRPRRRGPRAAAERRRLLHRA